MMLYVKRNKKMLITKKKNYNFNCCDLIIIILTLFSKHFDFILKTFFFVINIFIYFHTQHHNIASIKKTKKQTNIYSISQKSSQREGEREGQGKHKIRDTLNKRNKRHFK